MTVAAAEAALHFAKVGQIWALRMSLSGQRCFSLSFFFLFSLFFPRGGLRRTS